MDALLDTMVDTPYDSLGNHSRGELESLPEQKGTEMESTHEHSVMIPSKDIAQAPDPATAEFFKESDPVMKGEPPASIDGVPVYASGVAPIVPIEEEKEEHEFFKEAPEFEINASGIRRIAKGDSPEWEYIQNFLLKHDYRWLGRVSDGTELWGRKEQRVSYDPARKMWSHTVNGVTDLSGRVDELEEKLMYYGLDKPLPPEPKTSALKSCVACECGDCFEHSSVVASEPEEPAPTSTHGNVPDTGKYDFEHEAHVRQEAKDWSQYAEERDKEGDIRPYDESGNYLCGTCDMRREPSQCARVEGEIDLTAGGCKLYHIGKPETDPPMKKKFSREEARYSEHEGGFGCHRCEYGSKAKAADEEGRESWCSFWGMHIDPMACCAEWEEGGETKTAATPLEFEKLDKRWSKFYHSLEGKEKSVDFLKAVIPAVKDFAAKLYEYARSVGSNEALFEHVQPELGNVLPNIATCLTALKQVELDMEYLDSDWAERSGRNESDMHWSWSHALSSLYIAFNNMRVEYYHLQPKEKQADSTTKSYGLNQPLGGTANPDAGVDDPTEDEDENAAMNMTSALEKIAAMGDDTSWWMKSARPTEQKIELLQKQLGLTPEQIELCINVDPSPQQKDFVATIAKWLAKKLVNLPEDGARLKEQLEIFQKLKKSPNFQGDKDIQKYDPAKLYQTVEQNQEAVSKKEKARETVAKGATIIVRDGDLVIYKVTDVKALNQLSGGTNWCTAHTSHASRYLKMGPSYVMFKGGSAFAQLHPASNQLMNRADVCMVNKIENEGETIAKFIDDPTALRGLQLLAATEPNVAAWVKENATDKETLIEVLGKKREEEAGKGTDNREMAVWYAITKGEQLDPKEEAMLPKRVDLGMLLKYGQKFHSGQPWEPLEKRILTDKFVSTEIADYAIEFLKGRWPKAEQTILRRAFGTGVIGKGPMSTALDYAQRVIKGRWPQLEKKFHTAAPTSTNGYGSAQYAILILKQAWRNVPDIKPREDGRFNEEVIIMSSPKDANEYYKTFMPAELWTEFENEGYASAAGLYDKDFDEKHDCYIIRQWRDAAACVRSIGVEDADEALDYALEAETEAGIDVTLPDDEDMVDRIVGNISYRAMQRIGQSLQEEVPTYIQRWASQNNIDEIDFTDQRQLASVLMFMANYAPECSVWRNMREAFSKDAEAQYKGQLASDLEYEFTSGMYERSEGWYTTLLFGPNFDEAWSGDWHQGPVYEVLDRDGAVRLMQDFPNPEEEIKNIGDGEVELWLDASSTRYNLEHDDSENNEEAYELMDRWYTKGQPQQSDENQMRLQFQSSLLKKKALVDMHETPTKLPPRDDMKRHLDEQEQDEIMDGVLPEDKMPHRPGQIDPRINPMGVRAKRKEGANAGVWDFPTFKQWWAAAKQAPELVKKNFSVDTVPGFGLANGAIRLMWGGKTLGYVGFPLQEFEGLVGPVKRWLEKGKEDIDPYQMERLGSKQADYSDQDWADDEQAEYFLDQVRDAKNEAKRHFMQEDYLQQIADEQIPPMTMEQLWDKMGDEYTAEFYGTPYTKVPDWTDEEGGWQGERVSSKKRNDFRVNR